SNTAIGHAEYSDVYFFMPILGGN
ncbi:hypothetical protein V053_02657, partial [Staphylococcus aureus MSSA-37]